VADWPTDLHAIGAARPPLYAVLRKLKEAAAFFQQRNASAILLTTEAAASRISFPHRWKAPVHYLPHGIDTDVFRPAETYRDGDGRRTVILFYANISERKGVMDMLTAFGKIAAEFHLAELWIAGEGDQLDAAMKLASSLQARGRIHFLGAQTRDQAVYLMQQSDIFCLASHGEPYGMTVLEAMSCGLPVIVTDAGGARYLADDEGSLRVPVKSPSALALAAAKLLADPQLRRQMGLRNRQRAQFGFAWGKVIDRLEGIYQLTLESRGGTESSMPFRYRRIAEDSSAGGDYR
jgi:glycosyltransferase involved in cell wall biosynthesis